MRSLRNGTRLILNFERLRGVEEQASAIRYTRVVLRIILLGLYFRPISFITVSYYMRLEFTKGRGGHIGLVSDSVCVRFSLVNLGFIKLNPIKTKVALVWVRFGFSLVRFSSVWFRFSLVFFKNL